MQRRHSILLALLAVVVGIAAPATAEPQGFIGAQMGFGYFYGEFGQGPNMLLFVGGTAEEFCLDDPDDPFNAEPGTGAFRIFERASGATEVMANGDAHPIHLYSFDGEVPDLLTATCSALFDADESTEPPAPLASGSGVLKVRLGIQPDGTVEVFNSVNGIVSSVDGVAWKVRGSADLTVVDGVPVGDPTEFVSLDVRRIGG